MPLSFGASDIYITNVDEASDTITYIGEALPGTSDSSASWRIKRIQTIGTLVKIRFASGITDFSLVWDDRASLTYS